MAISLDLNAPANTRVAVTGRHMEIGEALKHHVEEQMRLLAAKFFGRAANASVIFDKESKGLGFSCGIRFHVAGEIDFDGKASGRDAHGALAMAAERVAKQLRRSKRAMREDKPANHTKDNVFRGHAEHVTGEDNEVGTGDLRRAPRGDAGNRMAAE